MSGFGYDLLQIDADALIREAGKEFKFYRKIDGAYDVATGQATVQEQVINAPAVVISHKRIDGQRIIVGDKLLLIGVKGLSKFPSTGDEVLIGGVRHKLVEANPLSPDDTTVVLIEANARRA